MFKNLFTRFYTLSPLKRLEFQMYLSKLYYRGLEFHIRIFGEKAYFQFYLDLYFLTINIDFTRRCYHPGVCFDFSILTFSFESKVYDIRHWDYELEQYSKD